jgi:hypothetical protein
MIRIVGDTLSYTFTIRDELGQLHEPAIVQVSFLKGDGSEDVLTLGGIDPLDSCLIKLPETATYRVDYSLDVIGDWEINERWTDDGWTHTVKGRAFSLSVIPDPHGWADKAAP